jgi:hypothetical protein
MEGLDVYREEAATIISAEKLSLSKEEQKQFYKFRQVKRFMQILDKMKIFNTERIFDKYKRVKSGNAKPIRFNRFKQMFEYY